MIINLHIREATLADVRILDDLQNQIGIFERQFDPLIKRKGRIRYYDISKIKRMIRSKRSIVILAEVGKKPVGCGFGDIRKLGSWSIYKYRGYIGMMSVAPNFRGQGIGGKILNSLLQWFKEKKIKDIQLEVYQKNSTAISVYRKCGFKELIVRMAIRPR